MSKLKVFEAFAGYGSQRMALRNIGIDFEMVGISEIDIPAILSYANIHENLSKTSIEYPSKEQMIKFLEQKNIGLDFKTGKVKLPKSESKLKDIYRATILSKNYGDICLLKPNELPDMDLFTYSFPCTDISIAGQIQGIEKGKTRSGLLYECEKIIEIKRPKYLLLENVKNLVGKKFKSQFDEWLNYLESLGYTNYWKVLNAKDYGVPQNRERVFVVSILNDESKNYQFPQKQTLNIRLKDLLENQVEEKYYLSEEVQRRFKPTGSVYNKEGLSPTLDTMQGGYRQPCITVVGELECEGWYDVEKRVHNTGGLGVCVETRNRAKYINEDNLGNYRIRKLTPKECWRLMGCSEEDFEKAKLFNSDSQLYKQAGNSIVVNVLEGIFKNLFNLEED